jgi:hypothetical protein
MSTHLYTHLSYSYDKIYYRNIFNSILLKWNSLQIKKLIVKITKLCAKTYQATGGISIYLTKF